eukprot:XP_015584193.1 uncharacterized protein LOC107262557 [Ricinus communis]
MREWWLVFNDDQLNKLLALGLRDNPGLAEAKARIGIAQGQVLAAGAGEMPHLDTGDDVTRIHRSANGDHAIYNDKTYTVANLNPLILTYRLDLFGQEQSNIAMAQAGSAAANAQYKQSMLLLRAAIIKTYFALTTATKLVENQNDIIQLTRSQRAVRNAAFRAGLEPSSKTILEDANIAVATSQLAELRQRQQALKYALLALLGKSPGDVTPISTADSQLPQSLPIPATINLNTISRRPDVEMALWNARYFLHSEQSAQKAFYPNINLRALIGLNSIGLGSLLSSGSLTYAVGPALSLPIFDGGALQGRLNANAAAYESAIYGYNKTVLNAASQVATELANLDNTQQILAEVEKNLNRLQAYALVTQAEYRSGLNDQSEAIGAKLKVSTAEIQLTQAKLRWLSVITDLATALGGEFQHEAE